MTSIIRYQPDSWGVAGADMRVRIDPHVDLMRRRGDATWPDP